MGIVSRLDKVRILALDSSSQAASVALCEGNVLVAESSINIRSTHSQTLLAQLDSLLNDAGWTLSDLDLVAVVAGPGAFTGLRIGLATAKGLGQALSLPVVTVSSLHAVAMNLPFSPLPVCVFLDARKKEVYCQTFRWQNAAFVSIDAARVLAPEKALAALAGEVILAGDGVPVYQALIERYCAGKAHLAPACAHPIQASKVAWLALQEYHRGAELSAENILPTYIRPSDAELNRAAH